MAKAKKATTEEVSTTTATVTAKESVFKNDRVTLKPIKKNGWLPDDHDGSIRYSKCFERLTVQSQRGTGVLNTGLTEEDERRLEKKNEYVSRNAF